MNNFDKIYKQNYNTMYRVAMKMINDSYSVSDIVQDVFIYFYEKNKQRKKIEYPKSWLYRATVNKCIDFIKQNSKFESLNTNIEFIDNKENLEKSKIIQQALLKLKPTERSLIILYSEGLSYRELAEATDIKFSSIGKTLSRTLKKLKVELKKKEDELF